MEANIWFVNANSFIEAKTQYKECLITRNPFTIHDKRQSKPKGPNNQPDNWKLKTIKHQIEIFYTQKKNAESKARRQNRVPF